MFKKKIFKITAYKCRRCYRIVEADVVKRYCPLCQKIVDEAREAKNKKEKKDG